MFLLGCATTSNTYYIEKETHVSGFDKKLNVYNSEFFELKENGTLLISGYFIAKLDSNIDTLEHRLFFQYIETHDISLGKIPSVLEYKSEKNILFPGIVNNRYEDVKGGYIWVQSGIVIPHGYLSNGHDLVVKIYKDKIYLKTLRVPTSSYKKMLVKYNLENKKAHRISIVNDRFRKVTTYKTSHVKLKHDINTELKIHIRRIVLDDNVSIGTLQLYVSITYRSTAWRFYDGAHLGTGNKLNVTKISRDYIGGQKYVEDVAITFTRDELLTREPFRIYNRYDNGFVELNIPEDLVNDFLDAAFPNI